MTWRGARNYAFAAFEIGIGLDLNVAVLVTRPITVAALSPLRVTTARGFFKLDSLPTSFWFPTMSTASPF